MFNDFGKYKDRHKGVLYVVLGSGCNFNCKYCIEGNLHRFSKEKINSAIYSFIEKFDGVVTFYGGEPFLYYDQMKEIVRNVSDDKHFAAMTNGSLIFKDELNFINHHCLSINLSWDGINTKKTRIRDAVEENWGNLVCIDDLWISSVISKYNYPRDFCRMMCYLDKFYYDKHGYHMRFFFEPVIKGFEDDFFDLDLERLRFEMIAILKNPVNFYEAYLGVYIKNFHMHESPGYLEKCGAGFSNVAINVGGDLYYCKNSPKKLGSLNDIDKYCDMVLEGDKNIYKEECLKCSISRICMGGCRINAFRENFCAVQKAFFEPVMDFYMENLK